MLCFDLPALSQPSCDRPTPPHKHYPRVEGWCHKAAPKHGGTHAKSLKNQRTEAGKEHSMTGADNCCLTRHMQIIQKMENLSSEMESHAPLQ